MMTLRPPRHVSGDDGTSRGLMDQEGWRVFFDGHDDVAMTMLDGDRPWSGCDIDQQWSERQASGASEPEGAK